ncbi:MAG: hypothetical protein ACYSSM_06185 [Planctomycetota bacterium]|jgi:hypothetical protein
MRKKLKIADFLPAIEKAEDVINSCETTAHLRVARQYINVANKWMMMQINNNGGILKQVKIWGFYMDAGTHLLEVFYDKMKEMRVLL